MNTKKKRGRNSDDDESSSSASSESSIEYDEQLMMMEQWDNDDDDDDVQQEQVEDNFVPMKLDSSVDCNLTRADYQETEILSTYEQICMFAALCLYVEHHETFGEDEVDFKRTPLLDTKTPKFRLSKF